MNGKEIKIRLSNELYFMLKQIAAAKGISISTLANRMIKDGSDQYLERVAAALDESSKSVARGKRK